MDEFLVDVVARYAMDIEAKIKSRRAELQDLLDLHHHLLSFKPRLKRSEIPTPEEMLKQALADPEGKYVKPIVMPVAETQPIAPGFLLGFAPENEAPEHEAIQEAESKDSFDKLIETAKEAKAKRSTSIAREARDGWNTLAQAYDLKPVHAIERDGSTLKAYEARLKDHSNFWGLVGWFMDNREQWAKDKQWPSFPALLRRSTFEKFLNGAYTNGSVPGDIIAAPPAPAPSPQPEAIQGQVPPACWNKDAKTRRLFDPEWFKELEGNYERWVRNDQTLHQWQIDEVKDHLKLEGLSVVKVEA